MTQFEIFAGIDWPTQTRQVAVVDADGKILGERAFARNGEGLAAMADWILGRSPDGRAAAAIEKPHGPEVDALLERGVAVFALNPKQLDRFRDRFSPAGAKDDRRDARVLAGALATDLKAFREADAPPPDIIELRELSRTEGDPVEDGTRLTDKLKAQLRRCCPGLQQSLGPRPLDPRSDAAEGPPRATGLRPSRAQETPRPSLRRKRSGRPSRQTRPDRAGNRRGRRRLRRTDCPKAQSSQRRNQGRPEQDREGPESNQGEGRRAIRRHPAVRPRHRSRRPGRHPFRSLRQRPAGRSARPGCDFGVAPVTKRSGQAIVVQRRLAANARLRNAACHRAMAAIRRDKAGRANCHALRSRGHKHARAPGSVADRLPAVVCKMIETGQTFDPERQSKGAPWNPEKTLDVRLRVPFDTGFFLVQFRASGQALSRVRPVGAAH